jgi:predicted PurR-regulated permease PerM
LARERREDFISILEQSTVRIGGYLTGNVVVSFIAGGVTFVGLTAIGVPYALALAMWVGFTDMIPAVGAYLGAIPALLVASFMGVGPLIATLALFIVYQQVENTFIAPHVMKKAIDMSPAVVVIAVLVGGALFGLVGAIIALPVAAVLKVVLDGLYLRDRIEEVKSDDEVPVERKI